MEELYQRKHRRRLSQAPSAAAAGDLGGVRARPQKDTGSEERKAFLPSDLSERMHGNKGSDDTTTETHAQYLMREEEGFETQMTRNNN